MRLALIAAMNTKRIVKTAMAPVKSRQPRQMRLSGIERSGFKKPPSRVASQAAAWRWLYVGDYQHPIGPADSGLTIASRGQTKASSRAARNKRKPPLGANNSLATDGGAAKRER